MNMGDLGYALIICLFGMAVVFVILVGLSFMTSALRLISGQGGKEDKGSVQGKAKPKPQADESISSEAGAEPEDDEVAAAIAAVAVICMEREGSLVVRSIKRMEDKTPVWGKVSRQEQMQNRF